MDWKRYEEITKYIYETLGRETGVKIIGYGNKCKVKGKSNIYHQIDVLTSHSDGIHDYKTAIECKYCKEKINKDVVMKIASIIEDTDIHKGVIVSKRGFTKDGIAYAQQKNIGLVELNEIEKKDIQGQEKTPNIKVAEGLFNTKIEIRRPEILNIEIDTVDLNLKLEKINPYQLILKSKVGIEIPFEFYLTSFRNRLHQETPDKKVKEYFKFENANLLNTVTEKTTQINGFTLTGKLTIINEDIKRQIEIVDEVWMKMKSLFEKKSFTISKAGLIQKDKT